MGSMSLLCEGTQQGSHVVWPVKGDGSDGYGIAQGESSRVVPAAVRGIRNG